MKLSVQLSADGDDSSVDWQKAQSILRGWIKQHGITFSSKLSSESNGVRFILETAALETDILTMIDSLTEPFYDLSINIDVKKI